MRMRFAAMTAAIALCAADPSIAYRLNGAQWPSGSIVMHLQMGSSSLTLIDGGASWNAVAEGALGTWNSSLNAVSFRVVRDSSTNIGSGNGTNSVFWSDDVFGESFGSETLAVTSWWSRGNTITEADVVFNRKWSWNSYRGNLRSGLEDLRRVALHEFGHVLGLGHPDQHGRNVTALMNSRMSNLDRLETDDTNGARAMYGASSAPAPPSNRNPTVTTSCSPCTVESSQLATLRATATDPDGDSLTYQWSIAQGSLTTTTASATVWAAPLQPTNVTATVTVQDSRGGRATATVALQVVFLHRLFAGARLLPGQFLISANTRYRLVYQSDGNLVLYDDGERRAPWTTATAGTTAGFATLQTDGNFVVYDAQARDRFATGTAGNVNARMQVNDDGNVVVYRSNGEPAWSRF